MDGLLQVAEDLIAQRIAQHPVSGHYKAGVALTVLSGFLLCLGIGFLLYAAFLWAFINYSEQTAAALIGGFSIFLALLAALAALVHKHHQQKKLEHIKHEVSETLQSALDIAEEELAVPVQENPKTAVLVASLAGYIAGEKFL